MLISEIRSELVNELGYDSDDSTALTRLFGFLKSALRRLPGHAKDRSIIETFALSLTSGNRTVSLPAGFLREAGEKSVWRISDGNRIDIDKKIHAEFQLLVNENSTGCPRYYEIIGKTMAFDRKADQAYTIYLNAFKSIWDVELTDEFIGSDRLIEAVKDIAKAYHYEYEEDLISSAEKLKLAMGEIDEIEAEYMQDVMGTHVEEA